VASGEADVVVGTHALLSESVTFRDPAVVVIDEQHRFGVMQRAKLRGSTGEEVGGKEKMPHTLVMTATPIPRTLSLTLFGDLDHTTLTGLPPGRVPTQNRVVGPEKADEVYAYLRTRLERGEQAYVVVPAIDSSGGSDSKSLKSVSAQSKFLQEKFFGGFRVGTVHGRLKRETRQRVMEKFRGGELDVLVATTVIEVGVDVPNATVMVIEHAERFGLAQLHQLRGRVGRGEHQMRPLCVFVAEPTTEDASARMAAIASTNDGFKVAELDLEIRGMGEILGTRQSGLPPMRHASIPGDLDLLKLAKRDAAAIVERDPTLAAAEHAALRKVLGVQYGAALGLGDVG
ncbi:MAG: helicase-related protein, partial [Planctomycetota bacterium]